ncbi:hypothetical protein HKX48_002526 [Thoreauomyces humboldtii]|nr:hypothetical protein HKX48_002526 [Thoreauomyces humboldtii]
MSDCAHCRVCDNPIYAKPESTIKRKICGSCRGKEDRLSRKNKNRVILAQGIPVPKGDAGLVYDRQQTTFKACKSCNRGSLYAGICDDCTASRFGLKVTMSDIPYAGVGLFATETDRNADGSVLAFKKGELVVHYDGVLRDHLPVSDYVIELRGADPRGGSFYLDADGRKYKYLGKFVNHSGEPNAEITYLPGKRKPSQRNVNCGRFTVGLFASRDILVGEEILANYGDIRWTRAMDAMAL